MKPRAEPTGRIHWPARRLLAAAAVAALTQNPCGAQLDRRETERLFQSIQSTHQSIVDRDWARCLAILDATADLAYRGWAQSHISWFGLRIRCEARDLQSRGRAVTAETVNELTAPGLAHLTSVPPGVERRTGARMVLLHGKWWLMRDLGLQLEAEREELQTAQALIDADLAGQGATVREDMDRWAHNQYGQHQLLPQIQEHLRWVAARYGQGHRAALILRRAIAFAFRSADRAAEALALMDEAASLAARHHPGDIDLQMMIAGERAPCLAANGLWLEARDEFIVLRDWMLRQVPMQHGNLMRMNYHLAGIANLLGDHDQAEAFANAADHHAQQSPLPNDRVEVSVAHLQRAESRLLRRAPGAADEVRRELERIGAADGGTGAPAFSLAKLAQRTGDTTLLAWAKDFLDRHAHQRLQPLQPSRALVEITAAWSEAEQDSKRARWLLTRAALRGLSDRDLAVSVQSAFSLARRLAAERPDLATWWFKRGANALQALRQRSLAGQDDSMHRATLADHESDLREFIALLIDEGRYLEARDALRVLREEELHDFTRRSRQRAASARSGALAFNPHERRLEDALRPVSDRLRAEQSLADARARPVPLETPGMGWLNDPETDALLDRLQGDLSELLATPAPAAAPFDRTSGAARPIDRPPADTARLQYFVRDQHLDVLVTTVRGFQRIRVPVARADLNRRVHAWRAALLNPEADTAAGAREFHDLMFRPLKAHLHNVRNLAVSLDGALRYLPLAALHDGQRYLVQTFNLSMDDGIESVRGPGAASARPSAAASIAPSLRLAAFGRTAPDAEHAALPGVDAEMQALADLGQRARATRSQDLVLRDGAFTAQALQDTLSMAPSVVHIASHFHLAAADEESSYLLLGDGQRLSLARLAQMPWERVRLVLLSACDSAVVDAPNQGRELNGLAGVLRQAGAHSVLASLWPIGDASTASFMREFYRPLAQPGMVGRGTTRDRAALDSRLPNVTWLTQAQRRWLARHPRGAYAHPYHWAAFTWWSGSSWGPHLRSGPP